MDNDQFCPHCKTSKYRNPSLKLYVNVCGHPLCENCLDLLFLKGTGNCTQCGLSLRKNNFRLRLFDDDLVEKEIDIRKKILRDFNKKEDDFNCLSEYDDYLEQIETIIYNLTYNIDVEETKKLIENYKKQNADIIIKNRDKLSKDEIYIEHLLKLTDEKESLRKKLNEFTSANDQLSKMKKLQKEALVDELMYSDLPASEILATHTNDLKIREEECKLSEHEQDKIKLKMLKHQNNLNQRNKPSYFSTGIQQGKASNIFAPVPEDQSKPYVYCKPEFNIRGPKLPTLDQIQKGNYLKNVRRLEIEEQAGGFQSYYCCQRALLDAFNGLYFDEN